MFSVCSLSAYKWNFNTFMEIFLLFSCFLFNYFFLLLLHISSNAVLFMLSMKCILLITITDNLLHYYVHGAFVQSYFFSTSFKTPINFMMNKLEAKLHLLCACVIFFCKIRQNWNTSPSDKFLRHLFFPFIRGLCIAYLLYGATIKNVLFTVV